MQEPKRNSDVNMLRVDVKECWEEFAARMSGFGHVVIMIEGMRTPERQDWLYASGRTRPGKILTFKKGNSPTARHVAPPGKATALDFCFLVKHGDDPNGPFGAFGARQPWKLAGDTWIELAHARNLKARWGGSWSDLDHLEID